MSIIWETSIYLIFITKNEEDTYLTLIWLGFQLDAKWFFGGQGGEAKNTPQIDTVLLVGLGRNRLARL